jgi:hypothetical protein
MNKRANQESGRAQEMPWNWVEIEVSDGGEALKDVLVGVY